MSVQRRRGQPATVYATTETTDRRGNKTIAADMSKPIEVRAAFIPQRSARAEAPGQVDIEIVRMIVAHDLPDVNLWSVVDWKGRMWDVVTPPAYHHGTRHTRHWSLDIRARP